MKGTGIELRCHSNVEYVIIPYLFIANTTYFKNKTETQPTTSFQAQLVSKALYHLG